MVPGLMDTPLLKVLAGQYARGDYEGIVRGETAKYLWEECECSIFFLEGREHRTGADLREGAMLGTLYMRRCSLSATRRVISLVRKW